MSTTKDRLIVCAATLFAERGCKAITMDDIASSAGMSKRTIYENFADKGELLEACLHYFFEYHELDIRKILQSSDNIISAIFKMLENTSKFFFQLRFNFLNEVQKYYPEIYGNTVKVYRQQYLDNTEKLLQKGKQEEIIEDFINPKIMSVLINEVSNLVLQKNIFADYGIDKKTAMDACMGCITRGMFTAKGRQILDKHLDDFRRT
ncbi:MAG: TetR/AcrR family transcriptional regulator [Tannerella sp.]|jgi:AcrR family transcriptional regulator|nr:TetR/AcrR family transcriptional regulator [Tannerella sp.]